MMISRFSSLKDVTPTGSVTIEEYLDSVKNGESEKIMNLLKSIWAEKDKKKRDILKENLHGFSPSCTVHPTRSEKNFSAHSGFLLLDIDGIGVDKIEDTKQLLSRDKYTYAIFKSASNVGLCVLVRVKFPADLDKEKVIEKHKSAYKFMAGYYFNSFNIPVDPKPSNPTSFRYYSYDPDLIINKSSVFSSFFKEPKIHTVPLILLDDQIVELCNTIRNSGRALCNDYETLMQVGFALSHEFEERGREYFHMVCCNYEHYNRENIDKHYNHFVKSRNTGSKITINTFYYIAKREGFELPKADAKTTNKLLVSNSLGLSNDQKTKFIPESAKHYIEKIVQKFDAQSVDLKNPAQRLDLIDSFIQVFANPYRNEINQKLYFKSPFFAGSEKEIEATEGMRNRLIIEGLRILGVELKVAEFTLILNSTCIEQVNPFNRFFEENKDNPSLKITKLEEATQLQKLCDSLNTHEPKETRDLYIKRWLLGMPAAISGEAVRFILVLTGAQNTGKSEFFRRILPEELKEYYMESAWDESDMAYNMSSNLIVMNDELGGRTQKDAQKTKALSSKSKIKLRRAYHHDIENYKRLALLCGTSNEKDFLIDLDGNTRYLPLTVNSVNFEMINSVNKKDLFLELKALHDAGHKAGLNFEEVKKLVADSKAYQEAFSEYEMIAKIFTPYQDQFKDRALFLDTSEIIHEVKEFFQNNQHYTKRMSRAIREFFGESIVKRQNGVLKRGFLCIKISSLNALEARNIDTVAIIEENGEKVFKK